METLTVSELVRLSRDHIKRLWPNRVWVSGELSNINAYPSGHVYMKIKDKNAEVPCVLFSSQADSVSIMPSDGDSVALLVEPTIYAMRGQFQLVIHGIRQLGQQGKQHEDFLRLKEKLRKQGWFENERKRDVPAFPSSIAVVVSLHGAAWRDVRKTLGLRMPQVPVTVFPAPAQGDGAAGKIAQAIMAAGQHGHDIVLVCRGGGSFEDLMAYNDSDVATAIHNCPVPVITGIGHESDETIADHVADFRAATPTAAATAAVPDRAACLKQVSELNRRLHASVGLCSNEARQRLDETTQWVQRTVKGLAYHWHRRLDQSNQGLAAGATQALAAKKARLQKANEFLHRRLQLLSHSGRHLKTLGNRLRACARAVLHGKHDCLTNLSSRLRALSPRQTMTRGFALVTGPTGKLLVASSQLQKGKKATIMFADGARQAHIGDKTDLPDFLRDDTQDDGKAI